MQSLGPKDAFSLDTSANSLPPELLQSAPGGAIVTRVGFEPTKHLHLGRAYTITWLNAMFVWPNQAEHIRLLQDAQVFCRLRGYISTAKNKADTYIAHFAMPLKATHLIPRRL